jgi:hypothetical protein
MPGSEALIDTPILISWRFGDRRVMRIEALGTGSGFRDALEAAGLRE